jgi:hypothetical protein
MRQWLVRSDHTLSAALALAGLAVGLAGYGPDRAGAVTARLSETRSDRRAEEAYLLGGAKANAQVLEALRDRLADPDSLRT